MNVIPKLAAWCSTCRDTRVAECPFHGKDGHDYAPKKPFDPEVYEPSPPVLEIVGKLYNSPFDGPAECVGYDPRHGFWMRFEKDGSERNISERAIGRTYHRIARLKFLDYDARYNPKTDFCCVMCQRDLNPENTKIRWALLAKKGDGAENYLVHPEDEYRFWGVDVKYDTMLPLGPECVKRVGREWTFDRKHRA